MRFTALLLCLVASFSSAAYAHDDELSRLHRPAATDRHSRVVSLLHEAGIARAEGRFAEAAAHLDSVALLEPSEPALARCRAQLALDLAQPEAALAALGTSSVAGEDVRVVWLRFEALDRLGRTDEAAALADPVLASGSGVRIEHVLMRARLAEQRAGEGPAGAVRVLDSGLERWPGAWALIERAISLEQSLGLHVRALARLDELLGRNPEDAALLARRGDLLAAAARPWEARADWTRALAELERRVSPSPSERALVTTLRARLAEAGSPSRSSVPTHLGVSR